MTRDHGEIDRAAFRNLPDRTGPPALGQAGEQAGTRGVAQRLEQPRLQRPIERADAPGGLPRVSGQIVAYLRHHANIAHAGFHVKFARKFSQSEDRFGLNPLPALRPLAIGLVGFLQPVAVPHVHRRTAALGIMG